MKRVIVVKGAQRSALLSLFVFFLIVFQPFVYARKIELTERYFRGGDFYSPPRNGFVKVADADVVVTKSSLG